MKKIIKFFSTITLSLFMFTGLIANASTFDPSNTKSLKEYETLLLDLGYPQYLLDEMDITQKIYLGEFAAKGELEFLGEQRTDYNLTETGGLEEIKESKPTGGISIMAEISGSDLAIFLYPSKIGTNTYNFIGRYEWYKDINSPNHHMFSMCVPSGWKIEASTIKKQTYYHLSPAYGWIEMPQVNGSAYDIDTNKGVVWSSLSNRGSLAVATTYKGSCSFNATRTSTSNLHEIKLQYAYSSSSNVTLGVTWGAFGVSYSGGSNVYQTTRVLPFSK